MLRAEKTVKHEGDGVADGSQGTWNNLQDLENRLREAMIKGRIETIQGIVLLEYFEEPRAPQVV